MAEAMPYKDLLHSLPKESEVVILGEAENSSGALALK